MHSKLRYVSGRLVCHRFATLPNNHKNRHGLKGSLFCFTAAMLLQQCIMSFDSCMTSMQLSPAWNACDYLHVPSTRPSSLLCTVVLPLPLCKGLQQYNKVLAMQSRKETMMTKIDGAAMDAETVQMLSIIDEEKDANIIITAEGVIQFANRGVTTVRHRCSLMIMLSTCAQQPCMDTQTALTSHQHVTVWSRYFTLFTCACNNSEAFHYRCLGGVRQMLRARIFQC